MQRVAPDPRWTRWACAGPAGSTGNRKKIRPNKQAKKKEGWMRVYRVAATTPATPRRRTLYTSLCTQRGQQSAFPLTGVSRSPFPLLSWQQQQQWHRPRECVYSVRELRVMLLCMCRQHYRTTLSASFSPTRVYFVLLPSWMPLPFFYRLFNVNIKSILLGRNI